jgi:hypothetical protein
MLKRFALGAALAVTTASAASAAITVDGLLDAGYGASTAKVFFNPDAATSNFGAPTDENHNVGYRIYLNGSHGYVYGLLQANGPTNSLDFANLYFNVDLTNQYGSDLGFHITNKDAFIPAAGGYSATPDILVAQGAGTIEFAIPIKYFTTQLPGLNYAADPLGYDLPTIGSKVQLSLSQSFGYSVAGGIENYGADRLGEVSLTPEPATWAMMLMGFMGVGAMIRSRRKLAIA